MRHLVVRKNIARRTTTPSGGKSAGMTVLKTQDGGKILASEGLAFGGQRQSQTKIEKPLPMHRSNHL
jgi:hypothetical protein